MTAESDAGATPYAGPDDVRDAGIAMQGELDAGMLQDSGGSDAGLDADANLPLDAGPIGTDPDADMGEAGTPMDAGDAGESLMDAGGVADAETDAGDSGNPPGCPGATNACGGCTVLPADLGSACGTCALGSYVCDGTDALSCADSTTTPKTSGGSVLLDDVEDGDVMFRAGPFNGLWYLVSDGTIGTLNPTTDAELPTSPGASTSAGALHVSGSGFSDWGGGIQALLNINGCYVNAGAQSGLSFYARGTGTVLVSIATKQTVPTSDGGSCLGTCYDNFAASVVLTSTWKPFSVPWYALHQAGWGAPTFFLASQIKYLQFTFTAGSSMDLYLDDVSFY